jgi:hypothetical protein
MKYFCEYDSNNIITRRIVISDSDAPNEAAGIAKCKEIYGNDTNWVETFRENDGSAAQRYNAASTGFKWDSNAQAFYFPTGPYPSWTLNTSTYKWEAPTAEPPYPEGSPCMDYIWDEFNLRWLRDPSLEDGIENYNEYWDPNDSTWKAI